VLQSWTTNNQPLPGSLQQVAGFFSTGNDQTSQSGTPASTFNSIRMPRGQGGLLGTHSFKFGYQLNRVSNDIFQHWNRSRCASFIPGSRPFTPGGSTARRTALLSSRRTELHGAVWLSQRRGPGFVRKAVSYNHSSLRPGESPHQLFAGYLVAGLGEIKLLRETFNPLTMAQAPTAEWSRRHRTTPATRCTLLNSKDRGHENHATFRQSDTDRHGRCTWNWCGHARALSRGR